MPACARLGFKRRQKKSLPPAIRDLNANERLGCLEMKTSELLASDLRVDQNSLRRHASYLRFDPQFQSGRLACLGVGIHENVGLEGLFQQRR